MRLHRTKAAGILAVLLWSMPASAQVVSSTPILSQATRSGWLRFQVVGGRFVLSGSRFGNTTSSSTASGRSEKLSLRFNSNQRSVSYELSTPAEKLSIEIASGDRIGIRRSGKEGSTVVPVQFTQAVDEPITLTLGAGDRQEIYQAPTFWHLAIAQPEECRQHLIPLLELLHPNWKLAETAAAMEAELLRAASLGQLPDRRQWGRLVEQLADQRYFKREEADRQLRAAGQVVLSYLRGLDFTRLDAEQQLRVRRIIVSLSRQTGDDTAETFSSQLIADANIWLALLSREEESTRRLAAGQLGIILGRPVRFDPAADAATRKDQIERLKARIGGKVPGSRD